MGASVLIVDDEQPVRHMLRRFFEASGYVVYDAVSGQAGLAADAEFNPDLVLTDLKMPGMDGLEMAQKLMEGNPDRPVLMMTAYADVESARKAMQIGVYEYFLKPLDMHDLLAGLERALAHRGLVLENRAYQQELERKVEERTQALQEKVEELQARDALLRHLLSIQEPQETLRLALTLAMDLGNAQFGALYLPGEEGYVLRMVCGFAKGGEDVPVSALPGLAIEAEMATALAEPLVLTDIDEARRGLGMASMGVLPVRKGSEVVAVVEVGRSGDGAPIGEGDLMRMEGFLPYVAMAVDDCMLQEELPNLSGDVDDLLNKTERWSR